MRLPQGPWRSTLLMVLASCAAFAALAGAVDPRLRPTSIRSRLGPGDEARIAEVLARYQRIYQDFHASGGGSTMLDAFPAVADVKHEIFRDVGFLRDSGLLLVQDLASAEVRSVTSTGPDSADAVVYEEWNLVVQKGADRTPVSKMRGIGQGFRYHLRREPGGQWIVTGWDPVDIALPPRSEARTW